MSNKQKIIDIMKEKDLYLRADKKTIELISLNELKRIDEEIEGVVIEGEKFKQYDILQLGITYEQLHDMKYKLVKAAKENKLNIYFLYTNRSVPKSELLIVNGITYFKSRGRGIEIDKLKKFKLEFNLENFYKVFPEATVKTENGAFCNFTGYLPFFYRQKGLDNTLRKSKRNENFIDKKK